MSANPTLMPWVPDPDVPAPNGDPHEPLPQPLPGEPEDPKRMRIPRAAAHVGARPTTATRSSGSGGAAPRGDDAAALGSPVEADASMPLGTPRRDDSMATASASASTPCDQLAPGVAPHCKSRSGGRAFSTTHEARAIFEPVARKEGQAQLVTPSRGGGGPYREDGRPGGWVVGASASALPDDLDQVFKPLLWDLPNRRWHPVDTVNLKGTPL